MKEEHTWSWPVAGYLFLGGLGGGMLVVAAAAELFFGMGSAFAPGTIAAAVIIALGSGLLVFDLGKPLYFWRVFSKEKAILTVGAWLLSLAIICGLLYGFSLLPFSPWHDIAGLRSAFAWICLLLGLGTAIYTGVFLGTMKARPFWNNPALPILFFISAVSNGIAAQSLSVYFVASGSAIGNSNLIKGFLNGIDIGLLVLEIIILVVYVLIMRYATTVTSARIAASWLSGNRKWPFWGGMMCLGLMLPLVLYLVSGDVAELLATVLVLAGGVMLRFLVVYTNDRMLLPGEEEFHSWLPAGNETFLRAWEEPDNETG
jgi:formate-dependent nitrite reductase membrane component NrfD